MIPRRYYKPLMFIAATAALAPVAESPLDWWRVVEISTSLVVIALLIEFALYYRQRIRQGMATVICKPWVIYMLVASYGMLLAAATGQVLTFLTRHDPFNPLILLVTVPQITSLLWLLPIVGSMERDSREQR